MLDQDQKYFSTTLTEEEADMIETLSSLTGLSKATAIKLHLRQTLPARIAAIRSEMKSPSVCNCNIQNTESESQE